MGEISEFITLYIENSDVLEDTLDELSLKLVEHIQNQLYYGHGRITGNLRDSIESDYEDYGDTGYVRAYINDFAPYGVYVNDGHHSWEGYHFMEEGLEEIAQLYG